MGSKFVDEKHVVLPVCMHGGNCHVVRELSASETTDGQCLVIKDFTIWDGYMMQDRG